MIRSNNFGLYFSAYAFANAVISSLLNLAKSSLEKKLTLPISNKAPSLEILAKFNKDEITALAKAYAEKYNPKLLDLINKDENYFKEILNIEREKENPRKDYEKFGSLADAIEFFYHDSYMAKINERCPFNEKFTADDIKLVLTNMKEKISLDQDEQSWFANMKDVAVSLGFAANNKEYKAAPESFKGTVGDVAEILRITLTCRKNSPNLYYVMQILGKEECDRRIDLVVSNLQ